jgi:hypothetical protein
MGSQLHKCEVPLMPDEELTSPGGAIVDGAADEAGSAPDPLAIPPQTPLFRAVNLARYRRQEVIRHIQEATGRLLVCYVSEHATLTRDDVLPLMDTLHRVPIGGDLDFMLNTPGGDIDAAVKMVGILRRRVAGTGKFRVIVPDFAKSAGTLICIGADSIVMSDTSELGPIDPQIRIPDKGYRPAHSYVDSYDRLAQIIDAPATYEGGKTADAEKQLLATFDPALVDLCRQALRRSTQLAESLLKQGMLREGNWTLVAAQLTDNARWLTQHSAVIDSDDASSMGLRVDYISPDTTEWQAYWRLYCEQRLALMPDSPKLFESDYASLPMP